MKTRRRIYTTIFKSMLTHETSVWYTSTTIKKHKKDVTKKFRFIQSQSFRITARVYKTIATKTLKIKLHILLINLHMKKMMIKIMIRINSKTSRNAIAKTFYSYSKKFKRQKRTTREIEKNICNNEENLIEKKIEKERRNIYSIIYDLFMNLFV